MQQIQIHLTPEHFPATYEAEKRLISALCDEALAYCVKHNLPINSYATVVNGLLVSMIRVLEVEQAAVASRRSGRVEEQHFQEMPDGSWKPLNVPETKTP